MTIKSVDVGSFDGNSFLWAFKLAFFLCNIEKNW